MLREAAEKDVNNVAMYYHHETVYVDGKEDDICINTPKRPGHTNGKLQAGSYDAACEQNWNEQQENRLKHRCRWAGGEEFFL
jgi:hypothetical protein